MPSEVVLRFLASLTGVEEKGNAQWSALCPAHDDRVQSLSVGTGDDGKALITCHAGCKTVAIAHAAGFAMTELFPGHGRRNGKPRKRSRRPKGRIVAEYSYHDAGGTLLYQTVRYESKDFSQRRPNGTGGWIWKLNGVTRVLYRLPELLAADSAVPVLVPEGEKDCDRLRSLGFVATCNVGGAEKWKDELSQHLAGRHVVILPDADDAGRKHCNQVGASLRGVAASIKVLELPGLPDKGDVSDWLDAGGTADELRALVDGAAEWEPIEAAEAVVNEAVDDPHRLARLYLSQTSITRFWRQEFYQFQRPAYRVLSDDEMRAQVAAIVKSEFDLQNRLAAAAADPDEPPPKASKVTRALIGNVLQAVESMTIVAYRTEQPVWLDDGDEPFPASECLVTQNQIIWLPGLMAGKPHAHKLTARLFTANSVDYEFNPAADCPAWRKFLDSLWHSDPEMIDALQEIMGYLLLPDTSQQKMFMLIGPKRSGKGTIARAIRGMVGPDNCCAPVLGSLQGEFGLQPLVGKTVGIIGDARLSGRSDEAVIVERLLSITGEDPQDVNRKHREAVTAQLKTRFVLISNELPRLRDASATLPSRIILLRMTRSFYGREDHGLTDRILEELPGILQWSLVGYQRLQARGHFVQPQSSRELLEEMEELSSPVTAFVRDRCQVGPGFQVAVKELFGAWKLWSEEKGRKPGNQQAFGRDMRAAVPSIRVSQQRIGGVPVRHYEGIRIE